MKGMPFMDREVSSKDLGKPYENSEVKQKHVNSHIFKINIFMKIAYFLKIPVY